MRSGTLSRGIGRCLGDESGQGTTEYAILVGVLVVNNTHLQQLSSI